MEDICALVRNKGLREDLENVLSEQQLQAFDEREERREQDTIEARAYRDLAKINAVVQLKDSQKQEVLGILLEQAPERIEQEADARAFMSLTYGELANTMDTFLVRGLGNMMNSDAGQNPNVEYGSTEHQQSVQEQNATRIARELSSLKEVLDDDQLARYRKHLETEPLQ